MSGVVVLTFYIDLRSCNILFYSKQPEISFIHEMNSTYLVESGWLESLCALYSGGNGLELGRTPPDRRDIFVIFIRRSRKMKLAAVTSLSILLEVRCVQFTKRS